MKTINRLWRIGVAPLFRYSEFEGRSTRAEFWLFHLFVLSGVLLLLAIFTPLGLRFVHVEALRFTFETDGLSAGMKAFTFILFFG